MEIILAIATILGGITAIWFFIDKYRERKGKKQFLQPLASVPAAAVVDNTIDSKVYGAMQSGRHPFFISEPQNNIGSALSLAQKTDKLVFVVIFNADHPSKSKLFYSLGCFMDYFTTKQVVEDHFITVLVSSSDKDAAALVPKDDPLENCRWVVLSQAKEVIRSEGVYANPDEGLKRVRSVIEKCITRFGKRKHEA